MRFNYESMRKGPKRDNEMVAERLYLLRKLNKLCDEYDYALSLLRREQEYVERWADRWRMLLTGPKNPYVEERDIARELVIEAASELERFASEVTDSSLYFVLWPYESIITDAVVKLYELSIEDDM